MLKIKLKIIAKKTMNLINLPTLGVLGLLRSESDNLFII
jgi:hypothetical protein